MGLLNRAVGAVIVGVIGGSIGMFIGVFIAELSPWSSDPWGLIAMTIGASLGAIVGAVLTWD